MKDKSFRLKREILLRDKGKIILARVLLCFDAPFKKYPKFGIYSYFLNAGKDVVIFDTGPKYNTLLGLIKRKTKNSEMLLKALDEFFPGKKVREILISHYHFDHSENAPNVQEALGKKQGGIPLIRLHKNDLQVKRYLRYFDNSLKEVFEKAGYTSWKLGKPLKDGEKINGTDFFVLHAPGHTSGSVALVSYKYKVTIGGWWLTEVKNPLIKKIQSFFIDEDSVSYPETLKKVRIKGHRNLTYHPPI